MSTMVWLSHRSGLGNLPFANTAAISGCGGYVSCKENGTGQHQGQSLGIELQVPSHEYRLYFSSEKMLKGRCDVISLETLLTL